MVGRGPASVQKVQNGLSGLSIDDAKKTISEDKMSTTSSTNGSSTGENHKVPRIVAAGKDGITYHVYYEKEKIITTVTKEASVVDEWISDVTTRFGNKMTENNRLVVGFDIEWDRRARTNGERSRVAVLQLCVAKFCLIYQLPSCFEQFSEELVGSKAKELVGLLNNDKVVFVGAGIDGDAHKLLVDYDLNIAAETEELGTLAAFKLTKTQQEYRESKYYKAGLQTLAKDVLGFELPKERNIQLSTWSKADLSNEQVVYACLDAYVSFKLGTKLRLMVNPPHPNKAPTAFWKVDKPKEAEKDQTNQEETTQVSEKKGLNAANGSKANGNKAAANGSKTNGNKSSKRV